MSDSPTYYYVVVLKSGVHAPNGRTWELAGIFERKADACRACKLASVQGRVDASYFGPWSLQAGFETPTCISKGEPTMPIGNLRCDFLDSAPAVGMQALGLACMMYAVGAKVSATTPWIGVILPMRPFDVPDSGN